MRAGSGCPHDPAGRALCQFANWAACDKKSHCDQKSSSMAKLAWRSTKSMAQGPIARVWLSDHIHRPKIKKAYVNYLLRFTPG
jgi:hypothetical protein